MENVVDQNELAASNDAGSMEYVDQLNKVWHPPTSWDVQGESQS
jgi:hypothetical protein